jgi:hypothetical protein
MQLVNHESAFRMFVNGFQITFPNRYSVIVKNGLGAKCTQTQTAEDTTEMFLTSRLGGGRGPDVEVAVFDPVQQNISHLFGETDSIGFVSTIELINLLYIVSNFRDAVRRLSKV